MSMFFPSVEKGTGTTFIYRLISSVVLLAVGHFLLNIGPVIPF